MNKTIVLASFIIPSVLYCSCKEGIHTQSPDQVRADVRLGAKFYSIYVSQDGKTYVIKGNGSYYTEPFNKVIKSDTSKIFSSVAMKLFFKKAMSMKGKAIIDSSNMADAARIEIYDNKQKVYDSYSFDQTFNNLIIPIMGQLPKGFNPFSVNDHPW